MLSNRRYCRLAAGLLHYPFRRVDPDDLAAEPLRQQFGEATGAAAEIEDQRRRARIDVIRQQFLPQQRRRRQESARPVVYLRDVIRVVIHPGPTVSDYSAAALLAARACIARIGV
jgi:hypothetical protein